MYDSSIHCMYIVLFVYTRTREITVWKCTYNCCYVLSTMCMIYTGIEYAPYIGPRSTCTERSWWDILALTHVFMHMYCL